MCGYTAMLDFLVDDLTSTHALKERIHSAFETLRLSSRSADPAGQHVESQKAFFELPRI
jgi:hypothetical protein